MRLSSLTVLACLACLTTAGCRTGSQPERVIILGLDGMDPQTIDLMMTEGKLPNFARMRAGGAYAPLRSARPLLSPIIWTTIATGKPPDQHKIGHFVAVNEKTGEQLPVTSQMRKVKALWNIAGEAGRRVGVVGWWATWPAETVNGTIVSDHTCYHFLFTDGVTGASDLAGVFYPAGIASSLRPLIRRPGDLTLADVRPFVDVTQEEFDRPFRFEDDLSHFKWALATAQSYRDIGLRVWRRQRPDLLMVYIEATDSTAHLFGHLFRATGLAGELAEQQKRYGHATEAMYEYADEIVGRYLDAMDDRTTLVVLSDHGFQLGRLPDDPSKLRDMRRVSERFHRMHGILYLYGYRVKARARLDRPGILDAAPTVLALLGVAPARDMSGRVLAEGLTLRVPDRSVASFETGARRAAGGVPPAHERRVDSAVLEHLRSLGYLESTDSPKGDRNLAAVYFREKRYAEAARIYKELARKNPADGSVYASLAGAYGAMGRYGDALGALDRAEALAPLNPEIHHNRAMIYERQGKVEEAITEYRKAVRYNPQYEPSRRALVRLTGSSGVDVPRTEEERRAFSLAERASRAARRGDYPGAMKLLDEAERIAPRYALVYQYRANVAFLMGNREGAVAALEKALQIEPDNMLFRNNLDQLRTPRSESK